MSEALCQRSTSMLCPPPAVGLWGFLPNPIFRGSSSFSALTVCIFSNGFKRQLYAGDSLLLFVLPRPFPPASTLHVSMRHLHLEISQASYIHHVHWSDLHPTHSSLLLLQAYLRGWYPGQKAQGHPWLHFLYSYVQSLQILLLRLQSAASTPTALT